MDATPPARIKTLLCDMGNVLLFFCHERMCQQIGELCGRSSEEIRAELLDSSLQWEFERGSVDEIQLRVRLEEKFNTLIDLPQLVRATADIFQPNESMFPVLEELKRQGVRLVLFSNTCVSHVNFIRAQWDFLDLFDELLLSYEVGAIKPEEKMFRAALNAIECTPEECLYVDDIQKYVEAARGYGLNAEVFTTTENFIATLGRYGIGV